MREEWRSTLAAPGFAMSFEPAKVEASRSGDLAYVRGTYTATSNDAAGKPITNKGKYKGVPCNPMIRSLKLLNASGKRLE